MIKLHSGIMSTGTDEDAITNILAYRSNPQRQEIRKAFKTMFGKVRYICSFFANLSEDLSLKHIPIIVFPTLVTL